MNWSALVTGCLIVGSATVSSAQQECSDLLRSGINNVYADFADTRSRDDYFSNLCTRYAHAKSGGLSFGSESFSVAGYSKLQLSGTQAEKLATAACETQSSDHAWSELRSMLRSTVSDSALSAWNQCLDLAHTGLKVKLSYRTTEIGFGGHDQVVVQAEYAGAGLPPLGPTINRVIAKGFSCEGSLASLEGQHILMNQRYGMVCSRHLSQEPFSDGGNAVFAKAHSVYLETSAGVITVTEPAIKATQTLSELSAKVDALAAAVQKMPSGLKVELEQPKVYGYGREGDFAGCEVPGEVVLGVGVGTNQNVRVRCGQPTVRSTMK